jgi:hypothetical protein
VEAPLGRTPCEPNGCCRCKDETALAAVTTLIDNFSGPRPHIPWRACRNHRRAELEDRAALRHPRQRGGASSGGKRVLRAGTHGNGTDGGRLGSDELVMKSTTAARLDIIRVGISAWRTVPPLAPKPARSEVSGKEQRADC